MAKAVKEIPSISDYPWEEWLKVGSKWKLTQGEDFQVGLKSMSCQCHTAAKRFKVVVKVRVRSDEKAVYLEVLPLTKKPVKKTVKKKVSKKKELVNNG